MYFKWRLSVIRRKLPSVAGKIHFQCGMQWHHSCSEMQNFFKFPSTLTEVEQLLPHSHITAVKITLCLCHLIDEMFPCRSVVCCRLGEEVGGLFLPAGPPPGMTAASAGVRDSGYDSLRRRLSILDRLIQTHSVWLQLSLSHQEATSLLQNQPTGVRRTSRNWLH